MSWKPIDFQGLISLDNSMVEMLSHYLDEKESQLAHRILDAIPPSQANTIAPPQSPSPDSKVKLSEAVEIFSKHHYQNGHRDHPIVSLSNYNRAVKQINSALSDYVQTIEGTVSELFQHLEQVGLDQWHIRLSHVVGTIKDILIHKIEDLSWSIRRLENQLEKCKLATEIPGNPKFYLSKISKLWSPILDRSLTSNLQKNQEFLRKENQKFQKRYQGFLQLQEHVDKLLNKLLSYHVLSSLDRDTQMHFIKLYQLLKLWEMNQKAKVLPKQDFIISLRNAISMDRAGSIFREYYHALRSNLFDKGLYIKSFPHQALLESSGNRSYFYEQISNSEEETELLRSTISLYRDFLLQSEPEPYVRTKLAITQEQSHLERNKTKSLLNLGYDAETLRELFVDFRNSLDNDIDLQKKDNDLLNQEIQQMIREMENPLASYRMLNGSANKILKKIQQLDELGSYDGNVINQIGDLLSKLMRIDWKYHVLFGFPSFHVIYSIHQGLVKPVKARHHVSRLNKCQGIIQKISDWVKNQTTQQHAHDIELETNDIKGYLQDFLGYIQRSYSDPNITKEKAMNLHTEIAHELLESRYLFGNFFYKLEQMGIEGKLIRRQFLFVDQYFETIEYKLFEIQNATWPDSPTIGEPRIQDEVEQSGDEDRSDDND